MKWHPLILGLVVSCWSVVGRAAVSEPELRVEVLPVQLHGELPPDTASEVRSLIVEGLGDDGDVVTIEGDVSCEDDVCQREAARSSSADYVLGAQVSGDEDEYTVSLTLFLGSTGEVLLPSTQSCSICGLIEVRAMARMRVLDVRAEIVRRRAQPAPQKSKDRSRLQLAGWTLGGAGGAMTIGGVALLALRGRGVGCRDDPDRGECTALSGAVVLGVGMVTLAGAVTMVVLARRANRGSGRGRWSARPGGLMLKF